MLHQRQSLGGGVGLAEQAHAAHDAALADIEHDRLALSADIDVGFVHAGREVDADIRGSAHLHRVSCGVIALDE